MSEPEEVILDGAHRATTAIAALWRRRSADADRRALLLADVRGRLELFTGALFDGAPPIVVAEPPAVPNWFARAALRIPRHLVSRVPVASTDGARVRLPRELATPDGTEGALAHYRVLAVGLTAKVARGTPGVRTAMEDPLLRDLFLLCEAAAVDRWIVSELPGLAAPLRRARTDALARRPGMDALRPLERAVERLVRAVLEVDPAAQGASVPHAASPPTSLAWAEATAHALREATAVKGARSPKRRGGYRGLPAVPVWGVVLPRVEVRAGGPGHTGSAADSEERVDARRIRTLVRRPRVRHAPEDEDDDKVGMWMVQIDDPQESVEDPMGLQRPTDRDDDADAGDLADSLSELPEARLVPVPGTPKEVLASEDPPGSTARAAESAHGPVGVTYPEWDWRVERYHERHVVVREREAPSGDIVWADQALARHAREIRRIRHQFERLRPQRERLGRQADGSDIDLAAYVTHYADRRAGHAADDRLYEEVRPARRDLSILLLVDVSGSTDSWVSDTRRIVDVEKEAVLLVCEALDALGDAFAVSAFSGEGPRGVCMWSVKGFQERSGAAVRRRIAALEPDRFTRTGAAIRHATATLGARATRHRLLLLLSDGKPNDIDLYEGRYGVEDTRQAVAEARLEGIDAFCLTVDRQAPVYLSRIFGPSGYAVLRHAVRLPQVLVDVVRMLLKR